MGRHRLPSALSVPTLGLVDPPSRHARPGRGVTARHGVTPAVLAGALLVGVPGVALADDDEPPPGAVDDTGTALGSLLGTDAEEVPDGDGDTDAGPAPVSGDDLAQDALGSADAEAEDAQAEDTDAEAEDGDPAAGAQRVTDVELLEKNGSGVSGTATIDAERVVATAAGLDPAERYVSFFYGATSSASNANPCILDGTNPLPSDQTVGEWEVDADGNGTLSAANPLGERYLLQAGTISIRKVQHDFSTATALPVNPLSYSLVACGEVERLEVLDPVTDLVPGLPKFPSVAPLS